MSSTFDQSDDSFQNVAVLFSVFFLFVASNNQQISLISICFHCFTCTTYSNFNVKNSLVIPVIGIDMFGVYLCLLKHKYSSSTSDLVRGATDMYFVNNLIHVDRTKYWFVYSFQLVACKLTEVCLYSATVRLDFFHFL